MVAWPLTSSSTLTRQPLWQENQYQQDEVTWEPKSELKGCDAFQRDAHRLKVEATQWHVAEENETVRRVAAARGLDARLVLQLNRPQLDGLTLKAKLKAGTRLELCKVRPGRSVTVQLHAGEQRDKHAAGLALRLQGVRMDWQTLAEYPAGWYWAWLYPNNPYRKDRVWKDPWLCTLVIHYRRTIRQALDMLPNTVLWAR